MRPPPGPSGALGLASGLASGARSDWRMEWRLTFAFESLLNCTARLFGGLRASLVEGDGVGTGVGVGVCWGRGAGVWAYVR